jgi:hypothetical protein
LIRPQRRDGRQGNDGYGDGFADGIEKFYYSALLAPGRMPHNVNQSDHITLAQIFS